MILCSLFQIQITALCMCVSISATVALGCLFVPKLNIVLFQPHKNVRAGGKPGCGSGRPLFGQKSSRFTSLSAMNGDITSPSKDRSSYNVVTPQTPTTANTTVVSYSEHDCDFTSFSALETASVSPSCVSDVANCTDAVPSDRSHVVDTVTKEDSCEDCAIGEEEKCLNCQFQATATISAFDLDSLVAGLGSTDSACHG